ncbi:ferritin-like domain-containing protein [Chryseobacterium sp. MDT2-18]|uniref:YciE/YciF ferroxidase family protein n=1 Tax=Chryseobacterium sp. MDT2-18 TaxID=1259136 RepID=UPI00278214EA|nr:DUF892 family protein [Chryseobacterium sp. MDT2-18]MDQ0478117.1 ferritin-like metal-binding protein YciE [Chryseobacterium sp. MDT2-18]
MPNSHHPLESAKKDEHSHSRSLLDNFFINSLREMYFAETAIAEEFALIKDKIVSLKLREILKTHYEIHLKHKARLEKIFQQRNECIKSKTCPTFNALLTEGKNHLSVFSDDIVNWEIALILLSQKLAHYKIASYGGLAHLAINLNYYKAATLLAISVQEEEEYVSKNLDDIISTFLASHVEGYKN